MPDAIRAGTGTGEESGFSLETLGARDLDQWLEEVERRVIQQALAQCNGVQAQAARRLGVTERSLWHRIKKLGIQINRVVN